MLHTILEKINQNKPFSQAKAHCDVPCGIYDPAVAQISALTVIRMTDLINELAEKRDRTIADEARLVRLSNEKEEHAIKVKNEVRIIWGDYFKEPQFEKVPNTHELVHAIMMKASACKQNVDRNMAVELLELVNKFAEGFWLTKGVETFRAVCPYPPAEKVVYPKLDS
ncbi:MAG: superoxide dismutase, Ni [Deltaproteobacteria bacterium]|nr:MAG: superoxide dismutase, Ni [Deltaproteobacteria bacterium]